MTRLYPSKNNSCISKDILGAASSCDVLMLAPRLTGTDHSVNPGPVRVETQISDLPIPPARAEAKKSVVSSLAKLGCQSLAVELRGAPARTAGSQQQNMVGGGVGVGVWVGVEVGVNVGVIVGVNVGVPVGVTVGTAIEHKLHCVSAPEGRQAWKLHLLLIPSRCIPKYHHPDQHTH